MLRCCKPRIFFTDFTLGVAYEQVPHLEESRPVTQEPHIKGDDSARGRNRAGAHVFLPVSFASHNSLAMKSLLTGRLHFANITKKNLNVKRQGKATTYNLFKLRDNTVLFDNFVTKRNLCNYCLACKQAHLCKFQESQHLCGCYDAPPL